MKQSRAPSFTYFQQWPHVIHSLFLCLDFQCVRACCMYVSRCWCTCVYVCGSQRSNLGVSHRSCPPFFFFFKQGLSLTNRPVCLCLLSPGITSVNIYAWLCTWAPGLELRSPRLHDLTTSISQLSHLPSPSFLLCSASKWFRSLSVGSWNRIWSNSTPSICHLGFIYSGQVVLISIAWEPSRMINLNCQLHPSDT